MSSIARSAERRRNRRARSKSIAGATALAIGSLASGYLHAVRQPAPAYAAMTCNASTEATLDSCLNQLATMSLYGTVTITLTADIDLTGNLAVADMNKGAYAAQSLTIDGGGHTINGYRAGGPDFAGFVIDNSGLTGESVLVTDITMRNTEAARGSAVYVKDDGDVTLQDVKVYNGYASAGGGAVYAKSEVTIVDSLFSNNSADDTAGAVFAPYVRVENSTFSGNVAYRGGAVFSVGAKVYGSSFEENVASAGGALVALDDSLVISESQFSRNEVNAMPGVGGAIYQRVTDALIERSTFDSNQSIAAGGAAFFQGGAGSLTISNSTFVDNSTDAAYPFPAGGAIFANVATADVLFSTFSGNETKAFLNGNAIWFDQGTSIEFRGSALVGIGAYYPCYVFNSTVDDSYTLATDYSCGVYGPGSSGTFDPPDFALGLLQDNGGPTLTVLPGPDSVMVTRAPSTDLGTGITSDQRGDPRPTPGATPARFTIGSVQVAPSDPMPPAPPAVFPASAPRDVVGVAGDGEVDVSWRAPESSGSFPVSNYKVSASPGGKVCLTQSTTCTVSGLTNGVSYTFAVEALNGAGWGPASVPSSPVMPQARLVPSITLVKGPRESEGRRERVTATGSAVGVPVGATLIPFVRLDGEASFRPGNARVTVQSDGSFRWSRQVARGKGLTVYLAGADLDSNQIRWSALK